MHVHPIIKKQGCEIVIESRSTVFGMFFPLNSASRVDSIIYHMVFVMINLLFHFFEIIAFTEIEAISAMNLKDRYEIFGVTINMTPDLSILCFV